MEPEEEDASLIDSILARVAKDPLAIDFQISLFQSALLNYRHDSLLRPFPPGYVNENNEKNIEELRAIAILIPKVHKLHSNKNLPISVWKLMWWIIDNGNIAVTQVPTVTMFNELMEKTENFGKLPTPLYIFEVNYGDSADAKFIELRQDMDILYGYHGSRLENFHSIIHNGLHAHMNKTSLFGEGTYLSSDLNVSILFSKFGEGWSLSEIGQKLSCVAVCELIDHPDVKRPVEGPQQRSRSRAQNSEGGDVPEKYFVVTNNQFIRVKYVFVYSNQVGSKTNFFRNAWIFQHPFASLVIIYIVCLLALGLSRTTLYKQVSKKYFKKS